MSVYFYWFCNVCSWTYNSALLVIPVDSYDIHQPLFFGGCKHDYVCLPLHGQAALMKHGKRPTYKEFDADHWVMLSHPDEVNKELLAWIETITV